MVFMIVQQLLRTRGAARLRVRRAAAGRGGTHAARGRAQGPSGRGLVSRRASADSGSDRQSEAGHLCNCRDRLSCRQVAQTGRSATGREGSMGAGASTTSWSSAIIYRLCCYVYIGAWCILLGVTCVGTFCMQRHLVVYHSQILPLGHTVRTCSTVRGRVPDYYNRNNTSYRLESARFVLMMPGRRLNPKPRGASLLEKQFMC